MPSLVTARDSHACCAVRGKLIVFGGITSARVGRISSVEMLSSAEEGAFVDLPPLSCGGISGAAAIAVEESDSAAGQVLLVGGYVQGVVSTVRLVDLATGVCTPGRLDMLRSRSHFAAVGLPDGRLVCAGGGMGNSSAEMWGPPVQGAPNAAWTWRQLPAMSVARHGCSGCVMSDGRFAVLGGWNMSSCEALAIGDDDAHWEPLLPMHEPRAHFSCATVAGCVIVAGGVSLNGMMGRNSAEVFDEVLGRWLRLPFNLPHAVSSVCSALLQTTRKRYSHTSRRLLLGVSFRWRARGVCVALPTRKSAPPFVCVVVLFWLSLFSSLHFGDLDFRSVRAGFFL